MPQVSTSTTGIYYRPALGDFDGDGVLDFVGEPDSESSMALLVGKGDGAFEARSIGTSAVPAWTAATADLNGDGRLDLATIVSYQAEVVVRLGSGNRATLFEGDKAYPLPKASSDWWSSPQNLLLADIDGDGHVDMLASGPDPEASKKSLLSTWRGSADGQLAEASRLSVGSSGALLAAVDWNQDGVLDLVFGSSTLRMMLGRGDGSFAQETACGLSLIGGYRGISPCGNVLADFDRDQKVDLVVGSIGVFLGMTGCNFTTFVSIPDWVDTPDFGSVSAGSVEVADFNGDGQFDIVAHYDGPGGNKLGVFLGDGRGGFGAPTVLTSWQSPSNGFFLVGDLNHDTKLDLIATRSDGWQVLLNTCR